jgi:hypothetical protein
MITHEQAEQAVMPRQRSRCQSVDVEPEGVLDEVQRLADRGMCITFRERRYGKQGRPIIRLWYESSQHTFESR